MVNSNSGVLAGGAMGDPPQAKKVRLERAKSELTQTVQQKDAKMNLFF